MNLDWRRLEAVVFESDDWGLCAWAPDEDAFRALADAPAWRTPAGRVYGRTTLERADDVDRLSATLLEFRGADGLPPVWQANTVMAAPDFERMVPRNGMGGPSGDELPLVTYPEFPSRWGRPGLADAVRRSIEAGVWWPELHGLIHLPRTAWLQALQRGDGDARRAFAHQCMVCEAVEASGEFDASEPEAGRARGIAMAVERFRACFGRPPSSLCAPDYRWDERLEADAEALGLTTFQGQAEQLGHPLPRLRRFMHQRRWPHARGRRFYPPPRIAFEPRGGSDPDSRLGARAVHRAVRAAWRRGQPAIVSSHRANYAHLDGAWSEAGRASLRTLLSLLRTDGATFLTDAEVRSLHERGWSLRPVGDHAAVFRRGGGTEPVRFTAPGGVVGVSCATAEAFRVEGGEVQAGAGPGAYLLEWVRA